MVNGAYDSTVDSTPQRQIEEAETRLYDLAEQRKYGQGFLGFDTALTNAIDMANAAYQRVGPPLGPCDRARRPRQPSSAACSRPTSSSSPGAPRMGKTALATNIAYNIAKNYKAERQPDGTDKDRRRRHRRLLLAGNVGRAARHPHPVGAGARSRSEKIRRGMIDEDEFRKLVEVSREMSEIPLYIDQTGGISVAQLAARARKLKRQKGLGLLVVDYLQLLTGHKRQSEGRVQEVSEITTGLKALAKELAVPIVALSQLSRQVEQRDDKRPQLSDLRESGSIEQDADVVMFVFREEYYVERKKPSRGERRGDAGVAAGDEPACTARPRSSSASSATAPRAPCRWRSRPVHPLRQPGARLSGARLRWANGLVSTAILR